MGVARVEARLLLDSPELHDPSQFLTKYPCLFSRKLTSDWLLRHLRRGCLELLIPAIYVQ
ncbi:hypothetical protein V1504DRAFT_307334 [Lipomyces starkeyi]